MILRCLASGSNGNCYLLQSESETLILDCGIDIKKIKKGLNWNVSNIACVLCTHVHKDHSLSVKDFENMGINVLTPYNKEVDFEGEHEERIHYKCGKFDINAFALTDTNGRFMHTNNDGSECPCYGFLISHPDMGKTLYITDTELVKWRFSGINHILISCNYDRDLIPKDHPAREHIFHGHMELQTVKEFVMANKSDALRTVLLCHLSGDNADSDKMLDEVSKVAGCGVKCACAAPRKEIELSLLPF